MGRRTVVLIVVALLTVVSVVPSEAIDPAKAAVLAAGNHLAAIQNPDGGWFFLTGDTGCPWWGFKGSCDNTHGLTALGLIDAYYVTRNANLRTRALRAGNDLLLMRHGLPACDANPTTVADQPITADVFFLQQLTQMTGVRDYLDMAKAWFSCVMQDFPNASDRADERLRVANDGSQTNLGGWVVALDIRAALAVGKNAYALAEAKRIIARQNVWDVDDPDCPACNLMSKGLLLAALQTLRGDQTVRAAHDRWAHDLVAAQGPDGSWGNGRTQVTAYAVMGLSTSAYGGQAVKKAKAFLLAQQLPNGGFAFNAGEAYESITVDSEVIQALRDAL